MLKICFINKHQTVRADYAFRSQLEGCRKKSNESWNVCWEEASSIRTALLCSAFLWLDMAKTGLHLEGGKKWSEDSNPSWAPGSLRQCSFPGGYAELSMQAVITTYQHLCCCIMGRIQSSGLERNEWSRDRFSSVQFWEVCLHPSQFLFKSSRNGQMEKKVLLLTVSYCHNNTFYSVPSFGGQS